MNPDADARLLFMASAGTLELTSAAPYNVVGSLSNVTLVEVTVDIETSAVTVVPGGQCLELPLFEFGLEPPDADWTCLPTAYDEAGQGLPSPACDCLCGSDPDCTDAGNPIEGCEPGQACGTSGCEDVPTAWTCAAAQYNGGPGNGCDCDCGTTDPDCDLPGEGVDNCPQANSSCNRWAACVPNTWACEPDYLGDTSCDCGCGAADPDCEDLSIFTCVFCPEDGSCGNDELTPFGCDLNKFNDSGNNASCL